MKLMFYLNWFLFRNIERIGRPIVIQGNLGWQAAHAKDIYQGPDLVQDTDRLPGAYDFQALGPGNYWVQVDEADEVLANYVLTTAANPRFVTLAADAATTTRISAITGPSSSRRSRTSSTAATTPVT